MSLRALLAFGVIAALASLARWGWAQSNTPTPAAKQKDEVPASAAAPPPHVERGYTTLWYDMSMPLGGTYDYAGNFSGRGMSLEYRHLLTPRVSVGVRGAWHVLSDKRHGTEDRGALVVTATELRTINVVPIEATGHYYFTRFGSLPTPYAGAGVGVHWAERRTAIAGWGFRQDAWHFGLSPEAGLLIPVGVNQIALGVRFSYLFPSGDKPEETYLGFKLGLAEL